MAFGLSGSSSKSRSASSSQAYGYSGSEARSLSESLSRGVSGSQATTTQGLAFEDIFASLYGGANAAATSALNAVPQLQSQAATLFSGGQNFLDELQGGPGADYLARRLEGPGLADEQIGLLGEDLGRFLREEINPAITSQGVATGTLGGGRQGVAQGQAASAIAREFQTGAVGIRQAEQGERDELASRQAEIQRANAATGLDSLSGLYGIAQGGALAGLDPYAALSQILGGPTTLTESQSTSFSEDQARSIAEQLSRSFGEDFARSSSSARSSSGSFGLSVG
jgi:hypothetical protein